MGKNSLSSYDLLERTYMENLIKQLVATVDNNKNSKGVKEAALARIRKIEAETGRVIYRNYNGASRNPSEMQRVEEENA